MPRSDRSISRRRHLVVALGGLAVVAGSAGMAVPAFAAGSSSPTGRVRSDRVIVCDSGITHQGDVSTSSAVAVRVPEGATVTVPQGCQEG